MSGASKRTRPLLVLVLLRLAGVRLEAAEFAALGCATVLLCMAGWPMGAAGRLTTAGRLVRRWPRAGSVRR